MFLNADVLAVIFSHLDLHGKKSLRSVNTDTVKGFNNAVQLGYIRVGIGTFDSNEGEVEEEYAQWFPVFSNNVSKDLSSAMVKCTMSSAGICLSTDSKLTILVRSDALVSNVELRRFLTNLPSSLREVSLVDLPALKATESYAFDNCARLRTFELRNLAELASIGSHFASEAVELQSVHLSNLPKLSTIEEHFLDYCSSLSRIVLADLPSLDTIGAYALRGCHGLRTVILRDLPNLQCICRGFAKDSEKVESLELINLPSLTDIQDHFMWWSGSALRHLVLMHLPALEFVGDRALGGKMGHLGHCFRLYNEEGINLQLSSGASTLRSIQISDLDAIETLPVGFLAECTNLWSVKLSKLPKLRTIERYAFRDCSEMRLIELTDLPQLESIGPGFADGCAALECLMLKQLNTLRTFDGSSLAKCTNVHTLYIMDLRMLEKIENCSLSDFPKISDIELQRAPNFDFGRFASSAGSIDSFNLDLSGMPCFVETRHGFLRERPLVHHVRLMNLPNLQRIGGYCFCRATTLRRIELKDLPSLRVIDDGFASECFALEELQIAAVPELKRIRRWFVHYCGALRRVSLSDMPKLEIIEDHAFATCTALRRIELRRLPALKRIDYQFALGCAALEAVVLVDLPELTTLGNGFLNGCPSCRVSLFGVPNLEEAALHQLEGKLLPSVVQDADAAVRSQARKTQRSRSDWSADSTASQDTSGGKPSRRKKQRLQPGRR